MAALTDVPSEPYQPQNHSFPKRQFGQKNVVNRSFQSSWFAKWKWIHYDASGDLAYCHICINGLKSGKVKVSIGHAGESTFISGGFWNWKDATRCFNKHEASLLHKAAVDAVITVPQTCLDVGVMLSKTHASEKLKNREYVFQVFHNIRFLARQGIALRGDGDEKDSNFMQLLMLCKINNPKIQSMLEKKTDKYTSPIIQNEMLQIMGLKILRDIADSLQKAKYFSLMADEVTDTSNREQVAICIRWVDSDFQPHEEFIGLHKADTITAIELVTILKDVLLRMNLNITHCRAQCYDGAANMCGARNGVATQISREEPRAIFIHCYGHALNLAAGDCIKKNTILRDTLDVTFEISKLVKFSPRRDTEFEKIKSELAPDTPGFRTLCPTRWTVRAASLESVVNNYNVLQVLWENALEASTDSEVRARLLGVQATMTKFSYLFGVVLGECILTHTDNLSKTLQNPCLTASEGYSIAELTCQTLERIRNDEAYDLFWEKVLILKAKFDVSDPILPRKRRAPTRYEVGSSDGSYPATPKALYRCHYFECLDLITTFIRDRFNQPGYKTLKNLENLLLKSARNQNYQNELDFVLKFYANDLASSPLKTQLQLFTTSMSAYEQPTLFDIVDLFKSMSPAQRNSMSEICTLLRLIQVVPATNAVSERSASALRRVKSYLRSTMSQSRLNNLMLLHVHKHRTDNLDLKICSNEFIAGNDHRMNNIQQF